MGRLAVRETQIKVTSRQDRMFYPRNYCVNDDESPAPWCYTNLDPLEDAFCFNPDPCDECLVTHNYDKCDSQGL